MFSQGKVVRGTRYGTWYCIAVWDCTARRFCWQSSSSSLAVDAPHIVLLFSHLVAFVVAFSALLPGFPFMPAAPLQSNSQPPPSAAGGAPPPPPAAPESTQQPNEPAAAVSAVAPSAAGTAAAPTATAANPVPPPPLASEPTDQAVLEYLRKKGLGSAALELTNLLKDQPPQGGGGTSSEGGDTGQPPPKSARERLEEEDLISRNQRSVLSKTTGGGYGYDRDAAWPIAQWGVPDTGRENLPTEVQGRVGLGVEEARAYLDAFTSLQLWVLSLPDEDGVQITENPLMRAKDLVQSKDATLHSVMETLVPSKEGRSQTRSTATTLYNLPHSAKPELLAVSFALLVHTYCELLEVGMESTAHTLRDAFCPIYEALYPTEFRDLYQCTTVEDIIRLNSHNSQHMEAISNLKTILVQVASFQLRREELNAQATVSGGSLDRDQKAARDQKIREYDRNISVLKQRYAELSQKASAAFDKMHDLPFLRRARAVRWQLTVSSSTYGMLASFFRSNDDGVLAMSTLLQTKCEVHVEHRDPLPFTPSCVFDETTDPNQPALALNKMDICWAAPVAYRQGKSRERLPFPRYQLEDEYDDEKQAARDKSQVEFNRSLLMGFRRLEALERKRDYEAMSEGAQERFRDMSHRSLPVVLPNPLEPSIHLTTLCSSASGPVVRTKSSTGRPNVSSLSSVWDESGIALCCAKTAPPDGRRIAVGCDDSAIRIFDLLESTPHEPASILLGHKNGFPVFDLDWNRDGRSLLSAGGDGSVRLWDTMAVGPFGNVVPLQSTSSSTTLTKPDSLSQAVDKEPRMRVPGWLPEDGAYANGAALAVYRGHAPSSPVWSVAFAPSGYYFMSTGGDATARLWTTDRPVPVRLFCGHTSSNVNCVDWHPNCNYVVTGGDDKTVRLWDIQTGRPVRLLDGCGAGINTVKVAPGGQYVAGADYSGIVHLWDLSTGKKVTQFSASDRHTFRAGDLADHNMIHRLSFSRCGSALAGGGDGCVVKVWDVKSDSIADTSLVKSATKKFPTKQTIIMDLYYTKRNLLMSVGKFVTPVPRPSLDAGP